MAFLSQFDASEYLLGFTAEGLVAFWPLTQDSQGKNRVLGGTELQLHGVEFPGDPGNVMTPMTMMIMVMMMMMMVMIVIMKMMMITMTKMI